MDYDKNKHLEFVQNVITRMNSNSFQIKVWTITIVTGILAVYTTTQNSCYILICILPIITFWILDTYYLLQERKFRGLYNDVAGINNNQTIRPYEMNIRFYKKGKYCFGNVLFSTSIVLLYLTLIIIMIGMYVLVK
jgi:hypothetical protein